MATKKISVVDTAPFDQAELLARWQKTRSARIADVLQTVPVDDGWDARLTEISKMLGSRPNLRARLANLPDDPRTTVFLIQCLQKARWPGSGAASTWKAIFKKLVELEDARAIPPLRAAEATPPYFHGAAYTAGIVKQIKATADALERIAKKQKEDTKTVLPDLDEVAIPKHGWFAAAKGTAGVDAILQTVWAAPSDDGVRAVAADALLELGDPRGELITLQLDTRAAAAKKHREPLKKLVKKHASKLAGAIAKVAPIVSLVYEKGFLAECVIGKSGMIGRRIWEDVLAAKEWSTVHTVDLSVHDRPPKWWLKAFFTKAALTSMLKIKAGQASLVRTKPGATWKMGGAQSIDWRTNDVLLPLLEGMPVAERVRVPTPASKGLRTIIEGWQSPDWEAG